MSRCLDRKKSDRILKKKCEAEKKGLPVETAPAQMTSSTARSSPTPRLPSSLTSRRHDSRGESSSTSSLLILAESLLWQMMNDSPRSSMPFRPARPHI